MIDCMGSNHVINHVLPCGPSANVGIGSRTLHETLANMSVWLYPYDGPIIVPHHTAKDHDPMLV